MRQAIALPAQRASAHRRMPPGRGSPALLLITVASALSACSESKDPIVIEAIEELAEDALREEDSAYEELLEGIDERDANDGLGHLDQRAITRWVRDGSIGDKLEYLFDHGDELTEIQFTAQDGIGSLKTFSRFSRYPTEGLFTGPNASSCGSCHDQPLGNGGGLNVANVVQDPQPNVGGTFNVRNTRNMNGDSWLQLAGMEMTVELQAVRASLREQALRTGAEGVSSPLTAKGINFGTLTCSLPSGADDVLCDYSRCAGCRSISSCALAVGKATTPPSVPSPKTRSLAKWAFTPIGSPITSRVLGNLCPATSTSTRRTSTKTAWRTNSRSAT